jgi:hypothetical protein
MGCGGETLRHRMKNRSPEHAQKAPTVEGIVELHDVIQAIHVLVLVPLDRPCAET